MLFAFNIPGKPVPKARPRLGKNGNTYTPKKTRNYERAVGMCAVFKRPRKWPLDAKYEVSIAIYYKDNRRRDIDNVAKSILDGLNGIAWIDDAQVDSLSIDRRVGREEGAFVTVEIKQEKQDDEN